jgi:hypothetical protein
MGDSANTRALAALLGTERGRTYTLHAEPDLAPQGTGPNHDVTYRDGSGRELAIEEKSVYRAEAMGPSNDHFARYSAIIESTLRDRVPVEYHVYADELGFFESVSDTTIAQLLSEMEAALRVAPSGDDIDLKFLGGDVRMHGYVIDRNDHGVGMARFQVSSNETTLKLFAEARLAKANKQLASPKVAGSETCLLLVTVDFGVVSPTAVASYVNAVSATAPNIDMVYVYQLGQFIRAW